MTKLISVIEFRFSMYQLCFPKLTIFSQQIVLAILFICNNSFGNIKTRIRVIMVHVGHKW